MERLLYRSSIRGFYAIIKMFHPVRMVFLTIIIIMLQLMVASATKNSGEENMDDLSYQVSMLTNQVMLQQFFQEQYVRSTGKSGLHLVRQRRSGNKNYFVETHNGYAAGSIHDHSNNIRTVGLGQFSGVLNGVHFHTRHNDYRLRMPHRTSKKYHDTELIQFPDVPPEVTNKQTVQEEIDEMREWFKAWQTEDHSIRDYRKYFKPVLCYLEAGWTKTKKEVEESFRSDRHHIDAKTWSDLHDKERFTAYSGSKSRLENLAFLPTKIIDIQNGRPVYAQWNYRILCHPLKEYLSARKLKLVDDLSSRMMTGYNVYRHFLSKAARFDVNRTSIKRFVSGKDLLDELMEQIPGKDNYQARITNIGFESTTLNEDLTPKDVSRYHRWYRTDKADAMGSTNIHRGFSDDTFFGAMTTQEKIAGMNITHCKDNLRMEDCKHVSQKWTYAIPLEIIYLTPLSRWNPFGLQYHGNHMEGNPATLNKRSGSCKQNRELNGTNSKYFYQTPDEFFTGNTLDRSKADTSMFYACVLDPSGKPHRVRASGTYVVLPFIKDVGLIRQRYPIFPVHGEGSSVWKEVNALRDVFMDSAYYKWMQWDSKDMKNLQSEPRDLELVLNSPKKSDKNASPHGHFFKLSKQEVIQIMGGKEVYKTTSLARGHSHVLTVRWSKKLNSFYYHRCDGKYRCADTHPRALHLVKSN